jgi:uncharacterized protein YybS (DUF2232 family)
MAQRDPTDLIGGGLLVVVGVAVGFYAMRYNLGSLTRMGPGFFPTVLGFLLAFLGALVLLPALRRPGERPVPHWRPLFTILLAVAAFALTVRPFGMVPATFVLVSVAALAQREVRIVPTLILCVGLSVLGVLVFAQGLGVLIPAFNWPF